MKVGLTNGLANELGLVYSVALPEVGSSTHSGNKSVKVSTRSETVEFESPLAGRVRAVNLSLDQQPELLVQGPYREGWLFE